MVAGWVGGGVQFFSVSNINALFGVSTHLTREKRGFYWSSSAGQIWALIPTGVKAPHVRLNLP